MCFHEVPHFKYNKSKYMPYQTTLLVDQSLSTKKELSDRDWFQVERVGRPLFILVKNDPHWTEAPKRWFRMTDELHLSFSYYQQHDERPHQFSSFSKHAWLSYDLVKNAKNFLLTRYIYTFVDWSVILLMMMKQLDAIQLILACDTWLWLIYMLVLAFYHVVLHLFIADFS